MEALQPKYTFNPSTQRLLQCIHDRALKGTLDTAHESLPRMELQLKQTVNPHLYLWKKSSPELQAIVSQFPVLEVGWVSLTHRGTPHLRL